MKKLIPYIVIFMLLGVIFWLATRPPQIQYVAPEVRETAPKIQEYTDSAGNKHTVFETTASVVSQSEVRNPSIPLGIVDTSARLLKIARTQIMEATKAKFIIQDSLLQAKRVIRQLNKVVDSYQDQYVKLTYTANVDPTDTAGFQPGKFGFAYNAELDWTRYHTQKKLLGIPITRKRSYLDISSPDKRVTFRGLQTLRIEELEPAFGLRIQAAANYNPQTGSYGVGPAARIDIGRLSLQGNYTWYPESDRWRPSVNANYDLIRF